jgi:PAS domain S-box-containing protein
MRKEVQDTRFWAVFWSVETPMVVADDSRRFVAANAAACELIGVDSDELTRMAVDDITAPEDRPRVPELWDAFLRDGSHTGPYRLVRPDGGRVEVEFSATASVLPDRHLSIFVTAPAAVTPREADHHRVLTPREREVLGLIAMGNTSVEIGAELGISAKTVSAHTGNILGKLGAKTRAQAIALAIQRGDLSVPGQADA